MTGQNGGVAADLARVDRAFATPALSLLARKNASVVVAVFNQVFSPGGGAVLADRFHALVESLLAELRASGVELSVEESARVLCRRWVSEQWLVLAASQDGGEEYALTSHARDAVDYVNRVAGDRSVFGQSRIRTIVEAARRCAIDADPNTDSRLARIDDQIAELQAQRGRLAGGERQCAPASHVLEQYLNVRDMTEQLPADFLRLSEHVKAIHRALVDEFRQEGRRSGEVVDTYLQRSAALMSESLEGNAFLGAVELLRDDAVMEQLSADLATIVAHRFASSRPAGEVAEFVATVAAIRRGVTTVLEARRRLASTLRAFITSHDALRDRELDDALREAKKQLAGWVQASGPRARVPVALGLAGLAIGNTRERFYDPAEHEAPPPLAATGSELGEVPSLAVLRQRGGPSVAALRAAVTAALKDGSRAGAAEVFNGLPDELRRPAEVFGLMQLAAVMGALEDPGAGADVVETVRPDGSRRRLMLPGIVFGRQTVKTGDAS